LLIWLLGPSAANAQVLSTPDPASIPFRFGPVMVNPRLSIANAGVDTNVFNHPDGQAPARDFTITMTPSAELWLPMGRTWLAGTVREDIVWFRELVSERALDHGLRVAWLVPLTQVAFDVGTGWLATSARPGFEIDARASRGERDDHGAVELKALSRTRIGVRAQRRRVEFAEDEIFRGARLSEELNRTTITAAVTLRHELTPLTVVAAALASERDRFEFSSLRNSDSRRAEIGLELDPFALIRGSVRVGYRHFDPASGDLPDFSGPVFAVDVSHVAFETSRIGFQVVRDVEYSYDVDQPYYLQTGVAAGFTQRVHGPYDAEMRLGRQKLAYRSRESLLKAIDRVDRVWTYGLGAGYRAGDDLRIGFNIDHHARASSDPERAYDGFRAGLTVTYGR
jgi:hypothetical protein